MLLVASVTYIALSIFELLLALVAVISTRPQDPVSKFVPVG